MWLLFIGYILKNLPMAYGVIICTKCRKQAQIIEIGSSKTIRCQRCNANLMVRKLQIFFSSEDLEEAISVRTQIQAQLSETGTHGPLEEDDTGMHHQAFGEEFDRKEVCFIDNRDSRKKKKADELIIGILLSNNKQISYGELKKAVMAQDIDENRFEDVLKKMLQAGDVYSPSSGIIKIA